MARINAPKKSEVIDVLDKPHLRFMKDSFYYSIARIVPILASIGGLYIFTRIFTPTEYGTYSLVMAIILPIVVIITQWAAQPIGRFYSEYEQGNKLNIYSAVLYKSIYIICMLSVLSGIILYVVFRNTWGMYITIGASIYIIVESVYTLIVSLLPASLDSKFYLFVNIFRSALSILITIVLIYIFGLNSSSLIWGPVIVVIILIYIIINRVSMDMKIKKPVVTFELDADFKRYISYGFPIMLWFLSAEILKVGDRFFIQMYYGSGAVGVYAANYDIATKIGSVVSGIILTSAFPIILYMWADDQKDDVAKFISEITELYIIIGVALVAITIIAGKEIISVVLGNDFKQGYNVITPIVFGAIIWEVSIIGQKSLELTENTKIMLVCVLISALSNIILNLIIVPRYGYIGAAYTTLISYFIYAFLIWRLSKDYLKWNIPFRRMLYYIMVGIGVAYLTCMIKIKSEYYIIVVRIVMFVVLYVICIYIIAKDKLFKYIAWNKTS